MAAVATVLAIMSLMACLPRNVPFESTLARPSARDDVVTHPFDPNRFCLENTYIPSLDSNISEIANRMDHWLSEETLIEKNLLADPESTAHTHTRFDAFQAMTGCEKTCVGGACRADTSKQICGLVNLKPPCTIYSIGGNNQWEFELDILQKTSCQVHTFDCTGDVSRFKVPTDDRLHFHYICLGARNTPAGNGMGEIWTLDKIQTTLNHTQVDLLKMDIEGYEWPILHEWPVLTDITSPTRILPMQILIEIHYRTQMKELSNNKMADFKFPTDMVRLQSRLLRMGYVTAIHDPNKSCLHCLELSLVRIRCHPLTQLAPL